MAMITTKNELHTASRAPQTPARAVACALDSTAAASHVEVMKRFCKLILVIALLSVVAVGVVALKTVIWISHFNY
jgi:hypothetical protein